MPTTYDRKLLKLSKTFNIFCQSYEISEILVTLLLTYTWLLRSCSILPRKWWIKGMRQAQFICLCLSSWSPWSESRRPTFYYLITMSFNWCNNLTFNKLKTGNKCNLTFIRVVLHIRECSSCFFIKLPRGQLMHLWQVGLIDWRSPKRAKPGLFLFISILFNMTNIAQIRL